MPQYYSSDPELPKDIHEFYITCILGDIIVGIAMFIVWGFDVNEKHIGVHAKFLILCTACIKIGILLPFHVITYILFLKKILKEKTIKILNLIVFMLFTPWAVYCLIRFYSSDNSTKEESGFLYGGMLFNMIEGIILAVALLVCCIVACIIMVLYCMIQRSTNNTPLSETQQAGNIRVSNLLNTFDVLSITGKKYSKDDLCCICLENFKEGVQVTELSCNAKHTFHTQCISDWIRRNSNCPICRSPVSADQIGEIERHEVILSSSASNANDYGTFQEEKNKDEETKDEEAKDAHELTPFVDPGDVTHDDMN
ncbi:unnamed protein product [Moneuplotes crassus]|uniref:RING-type domain-containing protein n=1 Tax=Euplotes crassus TaxID=5936 RepID=A0AAD1X7Y5_EUPCR|nr:unnamed protein product [Moneuplotes crassus]